jgi:hypothetical protein
MSTSGQFDAVKFAESFNAPDGGPAGLPELSEGRRYLPESKGFQTVAGLKPPKLNSEQLSRLGAIGVIQHATGWSLVARWVMASGRVHPGRHEPELKLFVSLSRPVPAPNRGGIPVIWGEIDELQVRHDDEVLYEEFRGEIYEDVLRAYQIVAPDLMSLN